MSRNSLSSAARCGSAGLGIGKLGVTYFEKLDYSKYLKQFYRQQNISTKHKISNHQSKLEKCTAELLVTKAQVWLGF